MVRRWARFRDLALHAASALRPKAEKQLARESRGLPEQIFVFFDIFCLESFTEGNEGKERVCLSFPPLAPLMRQVGYWHDSVTLFQHTLKVAEKRRASGETFPAAMAEISLGKSFVGKGDRSQAISHFQAALRLAPSYYKVHEELGSVLLGAGQKDEARAEFERTLQLKPASALAHAGLGAIHTARGQIEAAIAEYREALQLQPRFPVALNNLAWIYATDEKFHDGAEALRLALLATRQNGDSDAASLDTLAAAYAEAGRFSEAMQTSERALQLAIAQGNTALADAIRTHITFYRASSPYRDAAK